MKRKPKNASDRSMLDWSKIKKCRFCGEPLSFIKTVAGKFAPVALDPFMREGEEPLAKGKYYDEQGMIHNAEDVPIGVQVWRAYHPDCPFITGQRREQPTA